jgi:hypothetical protein
MEKQFVFVAFLFRQISAGNEETDDKNQQRRKGHQYAQMDLGAALLPWQFIELDPGR